MNEKTTNASLLTGCKDVIPMAGKKSGTRARSAITGRFISKTVAKRHPKTSVVEKVKKRTR